MYRNTMKTITFSYDDGVTQDQRLVDLFNKYNLKCTFNLNSALGGTCKLHKRSGTTFTHGRFDTDEYRRVYQGHEVAVHTLTHPHLINLSDEEIIREVEQDRLALSDAMGYEVTGMAYPYGDGSVDSRVIELIRRHTGVKYSRLTDATHGFEPQSDLLAFHPSIHHADWANLFDLGKKFVDMQPDSPKLFYIWGHSYEFDIDDSWDRFEEFLKLISNRSDIRYCTNVEALL